MNTFANVIAGLGLATCASLATMVWLRPDILKAAGTNPWAIYIAAPIFAVACLMILATSN